MPIFISHTTKDNALAQKVFNRLKYNHDIDCYIDDMDKELAKKRGNSELTPFLVGRLRRCDTLLAVVTNNTKGSWWVPFEIGTAREMPRVISSYTSLPDRSTYQEQALPEYLLEWPRLRTDSDIDVFAREYKRNSVLMKSESVVIANRGAGVQVVRKFESSIMTSLGQKRF